jgi:transcriptional regulator with XRE-family HTH domain
MNIEELKNFRTKKGWTRKQLADKLAVSVKTIQAWEQGFKNPRPSMLALLDNLFAEKEIYSILNNFWGIALNLKPNTKLVRLYTSKEELDNLLHIVKIANGDNLNGYTIFTVKTNDLEATDLLLNDEILKYSVIKDIEIIETYKKALTEKQIKECKLRVRLNERKIIND